MDDELFRACEDGDISMFRELLHKNRSIIHQKVVGSLDTPLHLASKLNRREIAEEILQLDPSVATQKNWEGETPLHKACGVGGLEIVKLLLNASPRVVNDLNRAKLSALSVACCKGYWDVALELCNWMTRFASDETDTLAALLMAASEGRTEVVRKILSGNPSLADKKDTDGFSALHRASIQGKLEVINFLRSLPWRDTNLSFLRDNVGRTPLHLAVICEHLSVVGEFISEGPIPASLNRVQIADLINTADNNGDTVLHYAARRDCLEIIELLLKNPEMKVNAANNEGKTARDILKQTAGREYADGIIFGTRFTIMRQLKARKRANQASMTTMQQTLMVVAALIVTVTFQAGLNPPGGMWQESGKGKHNHKPGKAIQSQTAPWLFTFFMASNALGFIVSLALIPIIMILKKEMLMYVNLLVVVALISVEVAFILGLSMVSERKLFQQVEIFLLVLVTLGGIGWTCWKLKPGWMPCSN